MLVMLIITLIFIIGGSIYNFKVSKEFTGQIVICLGVLGLFIGCIVSCVSGSIYYTSSKYVPIKREKVEIVSYKGIGVEEEFYLRPIYFKDENIGYTYLTQEDSEVVEKEIIGNPVLVIAAGDEMYRIEIVSYGIIPNKWIWKPNTMHTYTRIKIYVPKGAVNYSFPKVE